MPGIVETVEKTQIPEGELASIIYQGALLRLPYLEGQLQAAIAETESFEQKYGQTLEQLSNRGLPSDADYEMHEDFIEWEYWSDTINSLQITIKQIRLLLNVTKKEFDLH
ncbi:hypothetical protein KFU94_58000 [Chloroflexi bacterium TSY]|nr:hypothetical protein [Chloroflexi bacterium TSY]